MLNSIKRKHHFGDKRFAKHFLFTIKCHVWQPFFRLKLTHIYLICCCCCCCFSAAFFLVRFFFSLFVCIDGVSALFGTLNTRQHTPLPMTAFNKYCQFDLTLSVHEVSKIHTTTRRGNKNRTNERIEKFYRFFGGFDVWFWLFSSLPIYSLPVCWFFNISLYGIYVCLNMSAQPKRISFIFSSPSHTLPCFFSICYGQCIWLNWFIQFDTQIIAKNIDINTHSTRKWNALWKQTALFRLYSSLRRRANCDQS